jgi:3-deoxy-D-manno-octulosonate 8-phosphate phosphatase (KDO 8-P phosphatase)
MPLAADDRGLAAVELVAFDFDGVFTDNAVYVTQDGVETVRCWRSDGIGLSALRRAGVRAIIVSTEVNPVVTARARKLNMPCEQAVENKAIAIEAICRREGVALAHTMFVGNDVNDLPALERVGLPVAVADAYPELEAVVHYRTRRPGGFGAVREICDRILAARGDARLAIERMEPTT